MFNFTPTTTNNQGQTRNNVLRRRDYRHADFRHNPYVGTFFNGNRISGANLNRNFLPNSSPFIGTFRHSPSSLASAQGGLKDILWENSESLLSPFVSQLQIAKKDRYADRHLSPQELVRFSIYQTSPKSPLLSETDHQIPCCAICLDPYADGDEIRVLECEHCFHKSCVDTWLLGTLSDEATFTSVCPTCRRSLSANKKRNKDGRGSASGTSTPISTSSNNSRRNNALSSRTERPSGVATVSIDNGTPVVELLSLHHLPLVSAPAAAAAPTDADSEIHSEAEYDMCTEMSLPCASFVEIGSLLHTAHSHQRGRSLSLSSSHQASSPATSAPPSPQRFLQRQSSTTPRLSPSLSSSRILAAPLNFTRSQQDADRNVITVSSRGSEGEEEEDEDDRHSEDSSASWEDIDHSPVHDVDPIPAQTHTSLMGQPSSETFVTLD